MRSIRKQLTNALLAMMFLGTIVMIGLVYLQLKEELDEVYDANMEQVAHAIAVNDYTVNSAISELDIYDRHKLKGEEEFLIQIWNKDNLVYSSFPDIEIPNYGESDIRTIQFDGQEWRCYATAQGQWLIQVSQSIPVRHSVIREIYTALLLPILIQFPLMVILIWLIVGIGFKPLKRISSSIEARSSSFLGKLSEEGVPQEIRAMVRALNDLLGRLDSAIKAQRHFTADAAHELRTPLTVVSLQLDILERARTKEERDAAIKRLRAGIERSTHMVQQLLELARQEPDAAQKPYEKCALQDIVRDVNAQYETLAKDKDITLETGPMGPYDLMGNKDSLHIMIGNLVKNAIAHTPEGGRVLLSLSRGENQIYLRVSDNGLGIPPEERSRIFDRFYRASDNQTTGSGLGLSIVKAIADAHGAEISVDDGLDGNGVSFIVSFPDMQG